MSDQRSPQPVAVSIGRRPEPVHTIAVYAFDGMAPFELGVVVEVFGLARPELSGLLAAPWYGLKVCADQPGTPLNAVGGFSLVAHHGLDELAAADTVIVVAVPNAFSGEVSPAWSPPCARRTSAAPGSSRSAPAPSRWRPPACWTARRPPPTGGTPSCSSSATPRSGSTPTCSTSTTATC